MYEVETRVLKQAVRRNRERFPEDFMYELSKEEASLLVSQGVIPSLRSLGGAKPFAFTEAGIAMLSSVLNSPKAMAVNVSIIRTFVMLQKMDRDYKGILAKLKSMEHKYDSQFKDVYDLLYSLLKPVQEPRRKIGYKK
jgi:hypothetical protein